MRKANRRARPRKDGKPRLDKELIEQLAMQAAGVKSRKDWENNVPAFHQELCRHRAREALKVMGE